MREHVVYYETRSGRGAVTYYEKGTRAFGFLFNPVLVLNNTCRHKVSAFEKILESVGVDFHRKESVEERANNRKEIIAFEVGAFAYAIGKRRMRDSFARPFLIRSDCLNEPELLKTLYAGTQMPEPPAPPERPPEVMEHWERMRKPEEPHEAERPKKAATEKSAPVPYLPAPQQRCLPQYAQDDLRKRQILGYLEKRGVLQLLLDDGIYCDRNYHLKISRKDHGARGVDAARAICQQLSKLGMENSGVQRTIRQDHGEIILTEYGKQQLMEIRNSCGYGR